MYRRRFLRTSAALALAGPLLPVRGYSNLTGVYNTTEIRGNVGYYTNRGGTIAYYLPPGGAVGGVVVDSQFPEQARDFLEEAASEMASLDLLINTHHHGDHTGGNGVIAPLAKDYVAHQRTRENLEANEAKRTEGEAIPLPTTTFEKDWTTVLPNGKEVVTARHFGPAHTGGDAVIHFENANVAHMGDLVFNRRFPYIDPAAGGNMTNWIDVIAKVRKAYDRDTIFVFGHAAESYPVTGDRDDLRAFQGYLESLRKYVKKEKRSGTSLEALKAKTVTIPNAPEWRYGERLRDVNLEVMWTEV
ncbi:glyoxylase-like metal-dependent hydrolase (beta-lactamase superfamily II) [Lewinella aquimaris]|uniref:Glyoxylase-like metal-dependent hydrolase (Beta-lactamase superfamily II) n=1 Tax=Neolewinella aquimaris TaxID=1835722 RepID=A0A840DZA3_9BACT|nr:MBL fold metallo-hydrolase [Neolewinella aquimaris]MBB4078321.1 glyoxylase-like metal-dependent hydrolase (beta-lactamase superfamily II) [Neolewinella aquimaris]